MSRILIGLTATLTAFAVMAPGASAQIAEPVESASICDTYGNGFFNLLGTGTRLKFNGEVRVESFATKTAGTSKVTTRAIADLGFHARIETDYGEFQAYFSHRFIKFDGVDGVINTSDRVFLSLGGLQIGYAPTFFTEHHDNAWQKASYLAHFSLDRAAYLHYTFSGNDFSTTVGIQDTTFSPESGISDESSIDPYVGVSYQGDRARLAGTILYNSAASALVWKASIEFDADDDISLKAWYSGDNGSENYVIGDGSPAVGWEWGADVVYKINGNLSIWTGYTDADFADAERVGIGARWEPGWRLSIRPEVVFGPDFNQARLRVVKTF